VRDIATTRADLDRLDRIWTQRWVRAVNAAGESNRYASLLTNLSDRAMERIHILQRRKDNPRWRLP
jgi:hypothetical protein